MTTAGLLAMIVGMMLVTVLSRVPPIILVSRVKPGPRVRRWLRQVPPAVMAAIVGPSLFVRDGRVDLSGHNIELWVGLGTLLVALVSKNFFATIVIGVAVMVVLKLTIVS
jgi:branched-subunit amino acid transport protein